MSAKFFFGIEASCMMPRFCKPLFITPELMAVVRDVMLMQSISMSIYCLCSSLVGPGCGGIPANNRSIQYAAFEKPVSISKGPSQITFRYGSSRERYRRIDNVVENGSNIKIETTYLGGYENAWKNIVSNGVQQNQCKNAGPRPLRYRRCLGGHKEN